MPEQKLKAKKIPLQQQLIEDAKAFGMKALERLFGLTRGWEKHRDIVKNNYELGLKHLSMGNVRDAILRFKMVTWLEPKHADAWFRLGMAYVADGQTKLAKIALSHSLQLKPGNEEAIYMLAIASGESMPPAKRPKKIPLGMTEQHFDRLAADFTKEQLEVYRYQGHRLLAQAIRASVTPGRIDHVILELGIGTGLCGPQMRDVAAKITGVDISEAMLKEAIKLQDANGKKIYDELVRREMQEFLREATPESYDIVMAAALFSYVGALDDVYPEVARVLKAGGIFAFTVDKVDGEGFELNPAAGRFRFSKKYLENLASANGLKTAKFDSVPVYPNYDAWLCVFKK